MGTLLFGLSVFILRLETPRHIVTHNQSTVTNLEEAHYAYFVNFPPKNVKGVGVGRMVPLRSATFLRKKNE